MPIYGQICYIPRGMKPLIRLEEPTIDAAGHEWELWSRDGELSLIMDGVSVVTSRTGAAEANMAGLAVSPVVRANKPCIMVAGLGLGYGARAVLAALPRAKARFIIAEPVQKIVEWNRNYCSMGDTLDDERVTVECESAAELCRKRTGSLHAVIMRHTHARCEMDAAEAQAFFQALKGGCLLAILLGRPDKKLDATLRRAGFELSTSPLPVSDKGKQTKMYTMVLARRGRFVPFAER